MKKIILFFILSLFVYGQAAAASLTTRANRNNVPLGETFVLIVEYDNVPSAGQQPDFSKLNDSFVVYSISNSYASHYANGVSKSVYQWNVILSPKETGNLVIPALKMNGLESKPITIKVPDTLAANAKLNGSDAKFSISRVIDNSHPLVQEQIHYKLTITTTEELRGNEPVFLLNNESDWIIRSLGHPKIYSEVVDGVEVKKVDFAYALFPQKSGELIIPEVRFEGFYFNPDAPRRNSTLNSLLHGGLWGEGGIGFESVMARTPVILTAKPITVNVGKIPAENNGKWWFPAKSVEISSSWDDGIPDIAGGEVVDRTIYLKAVGVIDTQMPRLNFSSSTGLKQYPEKPSYEVSIKGEDVVSVMSVNSVYIPQKLGIITIPEIKVDWYNVDTKKMGQVVLPALKVNVSKGSSIEIEDDEQTLNISSAQEEKMGSATNQDYTYMYILIAFLFGIILSYIVLKPKNEKTEKDISEKEETVRVSKAFKGDDLKIMRDSVLAWARNFYVEKNITNLNDVVELTNNDEFKEQLSLLTSALYSSNNCRFNPEEFLIIFNKMSKTQKKVKKKNDKLLPDLYK